MRGCDMRLGEIEVAQADTILIAVGDGVLADSMRFTLELEGYETRFCDEHSLLAAMTVPCRRGCLLLDQEVFGRLASKENVGLFAGRDMPVILMVSHSTKQVQARAVAAGITRVVEKPLLQGDLFAAIRQAIGT